MRLLVISDIHGCNNTFQALLDQVGLSKEDVLILGGDYIDRGPDSKAVIDLILDLQDEGYHLICLKGNHEDLMLRGIKKDDVFLHWLQSGGAITMKSFGVTAPENLSSRYLNFFYKLDTVLLTSNAIVAHAGLNFSSDNPLEDEESMLWIRNWYDQINRDWLGDRIIVHGHTPITRNQIESQFDILDTVPALDIDCGCVYPSPGMHELCAFDLTNHRLYFEKNRDPATL